MEASLNETATEVLQLFACLYEQVSAGCREPDGDALASIASPYVQTGVARASVDGQEVQVGVEAGKDGVLLAILHEVRCGGGKEVRSSGML